VLSSWCNFGGRCYLDRLLAHSAATTRATLRSLCRCALQEFPGQPSMPASDCGAWLLVRLSPLGKSMQKLFV
jgi:hypothetical protein